MPGKLAHSDWEWTWSIFPVSCFISALTCATYFLAFPPTRPIYRKLSMCFIAVPVWYAFRYSDYVSYDYMVNDTFARTCLIWISHASYEICILEFKPALSCQVMDKGAEWKERIWQALKVLNDRNHAQMAQQTDYSLPLGDRSLPLGDHSLPLGSNFVDGEEKYVTTDKKNDELVGAPIRLLRGVPMTHGHGHGYTRWKFVGYHILKWFALQLFQVAYIHFETHWSPLARLGDPRNAPLSGMTMTFYQFYCDFEDTFDWCIGSIILYDSWHSLFAIFFVGTGLDESQEWSLALFGNISNAWSVRTYWSKHWHNFIYYSFNGHIKCVTRGWFGMKRGTISTRLVENTTVFFMSGLMHTAVRWQGFPEGDIWAITWFYTGQMIPIIIESIVAHFYRKLRAYVASTTQLKEDARWLSRMEYAVGYLWVFSWFMYCVSTYYDVRNKWTEAKFASRGWSLPPQ